MRAALLALLLLASPLAAAARFVALDATHEDVLTCGDALCVPLQPNERSVRIARGVYAFLDADGVLLARGRASAAPLPVPEGAVLLVLRA